MKFIRGATTVAEDTKEEMCSAVKELLALLFDKNGLKPSGVECIIFSVTSDIHAFHPAKAARMAGYSSAPLFSCVEPDIQGGLPLCIRVMIGVETLERGKAEHIYLRGAKILRKDISEIFNIALDGPAGSGKSTVAKALADKYGILYLDTGAMYRACGLYAFENGVNVKDKEAIEGILGQIFVSVEYENGTQHTYLNGRDVSADIRKNEISMLASDISAHQAVRLKMVELQRSIAKRMSCVLDGRDIGSTVLPDARFKFFVTADSAVRAKRRYDELLSRGQSADFDEIHRQIILRDKQDSERAFSPLRQAEDAIVVDTSDMSIDEVVQTIDSYIQSKI